MSFKFEIEKKEIKEQSLEKQIKIIEQKKEIDKQNLELLKFKEEQIKELLAELDIEKCTIQNMLNTTKAFIDTNYKDLKKQFDDEIWIK